MKKRVIITGPTGAVGMALIQKCINEKTEVLALCHKGSKRIAAIPKNPFVTVKRQIYLNFVNCSRMKMKNTI